MLPITHHPLLNGAAVVVLAADSMQERSGFFDLVTGARDCDYDEVCISDLFRIVCECDARVIIRLKEFIDLASVHVKADRRQVAGDTAECEQESDVAKRLAMQTVLSFSL